MGERVYAVCKTIIGEIYIVKMNTIISSIYICKEDFINEEDLDAIKFDDQDPLLNEGIKQLEEYFNGVRRHFDLPIDLKGTSFQLAVWQELGNIPYGETRSYQEIAIKIDKPKAVRAIGQANKANRLPIVIPCHRVIGKNQSLTGYAGTRTNIKEILLTLEGASFKVQEIGKKKEVKVEK